MGRSWWSPRRCRRAFLGSEYPRCPSCAPLVLADAQAGADELLPAGPAPAMMMVIWGRRQGFQDVQHEAGTRLRACDGAVIFRTPRGATVEVPCSCSELRSRSPSGSASPVPARQRASDASLRRRLEAVNAEIRRLREENRQLREPLAVMLGELPVAKAPRLSRSPRRLKERRADDDLAVHLTPAGPRAPLRPSALGQQCSMVISARIGCMATIEELLHRRTDLSTFLVHFTREYDQRSARDNLVSILRDVRIEARNVYGMADQLARRFPALAEGQKTVCFTETPLEHAWMMCSEIRGRRVQFDDGYGVAFTKTWARRRGINPVWYLDITRRGGPDWLTVSIGNCSTRPSRPRSSLVPPGPISTCWNRRPSCASLRSSSRWATRVGSPRSSGGSESGATLAI